MLNQAIMKKGVFLFFLFPFLLSAQKPATIEVRTKNMKAYPGFFPFYWDESSGKIWLQLPQTGEEVLYQTSLPTGLGSNDVGLDRGLLGKTALVKFNRAGNKVLMTESNYNFKAVTSNAAEKKAVAESFAAS